MTDTPITESRTVEPGKPLSRARSIYRLVGTHPDDGIAAYVATAEDDGAPPAAVRVLHLPLDVFADMAEPNTITVTVEPGDALNDLAGARDRVTLARQDVVEQVIEARRNGKSWADIGAVFGISRQAAWESYARHVPEATLTRAWVKTLADSDHDWAARSEDDRQAAVQAAIAEGEGADEMLGADPARLGYIIGSNTDGRVFLRMEERPVRGAVREGAVYVGRNGVDLYYVSDPAGEPLTPEERAAHYAAERAARG